MRIMLLAHSQLSPVSTSQFQLIPKLDEIGHMGRAAIRALAVLQVTTNGREI